MSWYRRHILPHLVDLAMRQDALSEYRRRLLPAAEGRVLEVGVGSGLNLPFYGHATSQLFALDPSPELLSMARRAAKGAPFRVQWLDASAEAIPLASGSVDTVVTTWTLCSIPDVARALIEVRRVLAPGGRLLFVEHGRAPDQAVRRWQDRLTPLWKRLAGGCHLNRAVPDLLEAAGFRIERMETGYMSGPKPMTFMYEGRARVA
jgi:ubiquinone/menaquinone biosynthesis C-methylase UbiE